jgi:tRNA G18 (ribose-2'-O)-methylase SpoU
MLCDHIASPANQGALFRLADAFGVKEIIFLGNPPDMGSSRLKRTARNTQEHVPYSAAAGSVALLQSFKNNGYLCIALEITSDSIPISEIRITSSKLVLIIGNERTGVSQEILNQANHTTHIQMYGHNSSMNVAQATAVALYQLSQ